MSQKRLEIDAQVKKLLAYCKSEEERVNRYLRIAQQYLYIDEHCEAERYLLRYLKAKPSSHEAHKLVGELYLKLKKFQDAYDSLKTSYELHESKDVLISLCQAAPHASIALPIKQKWLKEAEVANIPQVSMLSLKETVLRESDASVQEMEDVLKERSALFPLDPEAQIKLLMFYTEASRFEDCVNLITREEDKQELRNSPQWYRECQNAFQKLRASKTMPYDQTLALLHLHVSQRYTLGLITDPFFITDQDKGSVGLEPFFKQLEIFDNLLNEALTNQKWYREGLWDFVLDHFIGQLLFLFALGMLRRADESNREDTYRARGQALMFCALEYRPKKYNSEAWFVKSKDDVKKLVAQIYFDGCYRTTSCFYCLSNTSTDPGLADSVKIAVSGNSAIKFVTERLFPGKAIATVYNQTVISRACTKLPDRAAIAVHEMNSCIAFAGSLEHLVWLLLSGAEMPTEKIVPSLPLVPNVIDEAQTPSQSDIDAFLAAVLAAVKVFGNKLDIIRPTVPREILHRAFTTTKQQNFWNALYRTFVKKVTSGRDILQSRKIVNDGLEVVRGKDPKKSMPLYYLVQIARALRDKGHKKNAYFSAAISYFKIVLSRLDEHPSVQPVNGGGRAAPSALFEFPKTIAVSEETGGYRNEARLEIGKFLLYSGELENARSILELVHTPSGYLYYAKTAKKLCQKFIIEGDIETGERLLEKVKSLLHKGMMAARADSEMTEKLRTELESLEKSVNDTANTLGASLNVSGFSPKDSMLVPEIDMTKLEAMIKTHTEKILVNSAEKSLKIERELEEIKAAQVKINETLALALGERGALATLMKSTVVTTSDLLTGLAQMTLQISRIEELVNVSPSSAEYAEYQDSTAIRSQEYESGGLVIPPGAGLPQFNLTGVQHPSAQTAFNYTTSSKTPTTTAITTPSTAPASLPKDNLPASNPKILFDAEGMMYQQQNDGSFAALSGVHKICVFQFPDKSSITSLWYYDNFKIYAQHDLSRMTYETFETDEGQLNVQWTQGGKYYFIVFSEPSWQLGEVLMRVFQSCGVPQTKKSELVVPKENSFLSAALSRTPAQSPLQQTSPNSAGRVEETPKFTSPTTISTVLPGILPTPAAPVTSSSSLFSFSYPKSTQSSPTTSAPVSTLGGFTFSSPPVPSTVTPVAPKSAEKPKKEPAQNPFSNFSFSFTKPEEQKTSWGSSESSSAATTLTSTTRSTTTTSSSATTTESSTFSSSQPTSFSSVGASEDTTKDGDEDYECTAHFQPVIELPKLVETKTGEENEDVKFSERAKLYRFDSSTSEWKERGIGQLKILCDQASGRYRILMRRDQVLKICANHQLIPGMKLVARTKPTEYSWGAPDFADGEQRNEKFVVRFKTKQQADAFKEIFEQGVAIAESKPQVKKEEIAKPQVKKEEPAKPLPSLGEMFKPAAGSWTCSGCYVSNKADAATCVACATPNPVGGAQTSTPATSATVNFKFGVPAAAQPSLGEMFKPAAGSWNCSGCYLSNKADAATCVACATPNPVGGTQTSSSTTAVTSPFRFGVPAATQPLGEIFKPSPNNWNCSSCVISNPTTVDKCSSCGTARFGAVTTSPFKFGTSPAVSGASKVSTTFTFGTTPAALTAKPASGFIFGQTVAAPNVLASPKIDFGLQKESGDSQEPSTSELSAEFTFGSPQKHRFSFEARPSDDEEDQVVESQDRDFVPAVASLPPEVDVVTGEEGQNCLYSHRAKLFRFTDKEWKERGVGDFKILHDPTSNKIRLTMRRDQVHKVCLNHYLSKDMKFNRRDDKSLEWYAVDFSEGKAEPTLFALRLRNREVVTETLDAIHNAQNQDTTTPVKPPLAETKEESSTQDSQPKDSETKKFVMKPQTLFGKADASANDGVEVVKVEQASQEDVLRARKLMLPDHFFLYESRDYRCDGCRGCEPDEDRKETEDSVKAEDSEKTKEAAVKPKTVKVEASPPKSVEKKEEPKKVETESTPAKPALVFGAPSMFGTVPVAKPNADALKPLVTESTTANTGFVFGSGLTTSFSALAANNPTGEFAKPTSEKPWGAAGEKASFFSAFSKSEAKNAEPEKSEDTEEVAPSNDIHFEPVIPLPELVTIQTGEEEDEVLFSQRSKLYVYHGQTNEWKERAIGDAKILRCADGRARIVVRRETIHKVACNHYITENMELKPLATSNNSVTWSAVDFAEGDPSPQTFALRMKGEERLREFERIFKEEVEKAVKAKEGGDVSHPETNDEVAEQVEEEAASFFEDDNILFSASVNMTEELPNSQWVELGAGTVRVVYDDEIFGHVIYLSLGEKLIAETVIAVQTSLRQTGLKAIWMAQDTLQKTFVRRRFSIEFSSEKDITDFVTIFEEGKETALQCGIVETCDQPPWSSPQSNSSD